MKKLFMKRLGFDYFLSSNSKEKKKTFPFLVDMTVAMWRGISTAVISITEMTVGSALNALIKFEISHPYNEETQKRKDDFPFKVEFDKAALDKLKKSISDLNFIPNSSKNQLSVGDSKA
jgi:hypothetical protein